MLKIATLFSGIGAPESALTELGIPYELVYFCEFDKYAVKSYCAIHNELESKNIGDITKVDIDSLPKDLDLIVGGSPCQDFSLAGKRNGGEVNSGTRSSLMWNYVEIIRVTQPKAILWENVKGALSEKDYPNYKKFIAALVAEGYKISAFTLNGKMFGVPQNRERVFVLGSKTHRIRTPQGFDCGIRLKDVLESKVDEKYYLSEAVLKYFTDKTEFNIRTGGGFKLEVKGKEDIAKTRIDDNYIADNALIELTSGQSQGHRVYDSNGIFVTLASEAGGMGAKTGLYTEPMIYDVYNKKELKDGICGTLTAHGNTSNTHCGTFFVSEPTIIGSLQKNAAINKDGICPALTEAMGMGGGQIPLHNYDYRRIRRLTPLECFRLMGFFDEDFNNARNNSIKSIESMRRKNGEIKHEERFNRKVGIMSDSQLYKQAGNSIIVNVLMAIFGEYYGIDWKPLVYGKWHKTGQSAFADLPIMEEV